MRMIPTTMAKSTLKNSSQLSITRLKQRQPIKFVGHSICAIEVRRERHVVHRSSVSRSIDHDHQLDVPELESIIRALYELSDADMARVETYEEAMERIKTLLLTNPEDPQSEEMMDSVTKSEFVQIVQDDSAIMKLIDCRPMLNKRTSKADPFSVHAIKKQLKFKPSLHKSLSDSTLAKDDIE